ncbi:MAG: sugar ABC transporter permease [Lentisphaerae bacterium]|jgi:multiple sugar transport system permease protein|nr:sugar ABC transporter permease [Lentisphaerota bacterium]MBT4818062.1 sugar ABC transporter permease [Lentisphaerota bacterium]MBT5610242.1 sugar ABC transporter permease [Lentisphaerota bacterium]MBT7055711.1 sugar ABC transporter permease [Lentisphaerota bacterium]MBT7846006.1 sugar ABC transporter permease [Lentisphaerota bacterium]
MGKRDRHNLALGLAFLGPNILGFLCFTILPLVFSLVLAFSNWDLQLHNMFKDEQIKCVGFAHFTRLLLQERDFLRFFGNTLFFMMSIPFAIAGSLGAALLLSRDLGGGTKRVYGWLIAGAVMVASSVMLVVAGAGGTAMTILLCGLACGMLVAGSLGGSTVYRTLFYVPHFTSGVAVYILWKKLYNPHTGPVNTVLDPVLTRVSGAVNGIPPGSMHAVAWLFAGGAAVFAAFGVRNLVRMWRSGDLGWAAAVLPAAILSFPVVMAQRWAPTRAAGTMILILVAATATYELVQAGRDTERFPATFGKGLGNALMLSLALMVGAFIALGLAIVIYQLPTWATDGLEPPPWLASYHWAKPAIMVMGLWGAIGSNNMLLYLAGISNVPQELYEAADIDGASRFQRFWHVTWPQLAPVTFFIIVMSVIHGLQGGFEMARTMTKGGPAGSTTTLSYFIYNEGFETGRLGYASAVAWALFIMVFSVTVFNWKFGSRYVND